MTDKQIMVNDVNVSGCEHLTEIRGCWLSTCDYLIHKGNITSKVCKYNPNCYFKQLARKTQECEELKKQLMQKSEVDMFFNTPIEGWSNDPCGICPHKAENEELKERIKCNCFDPKSNNNRCISYNRIAEDYERDLKRLENKIAECEKYEGAFRRIKKQSKINCEEICGKSYEACDDKDCLAIQIRDIINKAKGEGNGN